MLLLKILNISKKNEFGLLYKINESGLRIDPWNTPTTKSLISEIVIKQKGSCYSAHVLFDLSKKNQIINTTKCLAQQMFAALDTEFPNIL